MTDHVTQAYLDDERLHGVMGRLDLPPHLAAAYGDRLVDRPYFLEEYTAHRVAADVMDLFELLFSLPVRLFGGSFARYADALGLPPERTALMGADRPPMHGRADFHRVGGDVRLLGLDAGSRLAGVHLGGLSRAVHEHPEMQPFVAEHELACYDPVGKLLDVIGRDRTIAFVGVERLDGIREACARDGVDVLVGGPHELTDRDGYLYLDGSRLDVVVRYFSAEQAAGVVDTLVRGHKTELYTSLSSCWYGGGATLALVADRRDELPEDARALVDRLLPWTRAVRDVPRDRLREDREGLVVKASAGGDVHQGWLLTDREWVAVLDEVADGPYVVQERVRPTPDVVPGDDRPWLTTWGWFVTDQGFAGMALRARPVADGVVVGGRSRVSGLLLY